MHRSKKFIIIVTASILLFAGVAAAQIFFLTRIQSQISKEPAPRPTTVESASAETIVADFTKKIGESDIASLYTVREKQTTEQRVVSAAPRMNTAIPDLATNGTIFYRAIAKGYTTTVVAGNYVQFTQSADATPQQHAALLKQATTHLEGLSFNKTSGTQTAQINGVTLSYYESKNVACEISDREALKNTPVLVGLSCVDKAVADTFVAELDALLALTDAERLTNTVSRGIAVTEQGNQLTTLNVAFDSGNPATLVFAKLGEAPWEYLGTRPIQDHDAPDSFIIPDKLKEAASDPKWNGFILKYIR